MSKEIGEENEEVEGNAHKGRGREKETKSVTQV